MEIFSFLGLPQKYYNEDERVDMDEKRMCLSLGISATRELLESVALSSIESVGINRENGKETLREEVDSDSEVDVSLLLEPGTTSDTSGNQEPLYLNDRTYVDVRDVRNDWEVGGRVNVGAAGVMEGLLQND